MHAAKNFINNFPNTTTVNLSLEGHCPSLPPPPKICLWPSYIIIEYITVSYIDTLGSILCIIIGFVPDQTFSSICRYNIATVTIYIAEGLL